MVPCSGGWNGYRVGRPCEAHGWKPFAASTGSSSCSPVLSISWWRGLQVFMAGQRGLLLDCMADWSFFFPFLFLFSLCMSHTDTGIHFRPLQIHSYFIWYKYCAINPSTAKSFSAKYYFLIQWSKHVLCRGPDLAHPTGRSTISRLACKIVSSYTRYTFAKNKYNIYTKQNKPKAFLSELSESAWCGPWATES